MARPIAETTRMYEKKLLSLEPGESFFVRDETQNSISHLRRIAQRIGVAIQMHSTTNDEIYVGQKGVRVWRKKL